MRSDRAVLVWASAVGMLAGLVAVLLKNGVALIRTVFSEPKVSLAGNGF